MTLPLISICIPTYGRVEILHNTLSSIFSQNVESELFEVCISDNSPTDETKEMLAKYFSEKINIVYRKSACEGYYNSIEALKLGKGKFLKLHNNYSNFAVKMFREFINTIEKYKDNEPLMFFSFGSIKQKSLYSEYKDFDSFLYDISYFSTWSTSFGIWKSDFDRIMEQNLELDKMFPHTSLLFALTEKDNYVIDNTLYFDNQDVGKKGGYNLPETFGKRYLGMCNKLLEEKKISENTFARIKDGILHFIAVIYFSNKYTFSFENWEDTVSELFGKEGVDFIKYNAKKKMIYSYIRKILKRY